MKSCKIETLSACNQRRYTAKLECGFVDTIFVRHKIKHAIILTAQLSWLHPLKLQNTSPLGGILVPLLKRNLAHIRVEKGSIYNVMFQNINYNTNCTDSSNPNILTSGKSHTNIQLESIRIQHDHSHASWQRHDFRLTTIPLNTHNPSDTFIL